MTKADAEYEFLKSAVGVDGTLADLRLAYFKAQTGAEGTLADVSLAFYKANSPYTEGGTVNDLEYDYWESPPASGLNIAVVTNTTPNADDNLIIGWLESAGHSVTQTDVTTGLVGYDVVFYTESAAGSASGGSLSETFGVVSSEYTVVSLNMASASGSAGPTHTQWDLIDAKPLNAGHPDPMTARASGFTWQHTVAQLAAGVEVLATVATDATRVSAAIAETGATLTTGTAAGRRVYFPMTSGTVEALTQDAIDYLISLVEWAGA